MTSRLRIFLTLLAALLMQCLPVALTSAWALEQVTLQLKWQHAFQFAGYYAAQELGYYRQAGLDVNLKQAAPGFDVVGEVLSGKSDFGVGSSSLLLDRKAGKPVVALAVIFQHSPLVLIAAGHNAGQSIHHLAGKRIMIESQSDELLAYLKREGVLSAGIQQQMHSFRADDLIEGKTDALSAYLSAEPYYFDKLGFSYQVYTPRSAGIDFYGDTLFTSEQQIKRHPERVKAFRAASLHGWEYAMTHQQEIIDLILAKYPTTKSRELLVHEATAMAALMRTDLLPIGYMNPGRWRHIADVYAEISMLPENFSLDGFLYDANPSVNYAFLYGILAAALAVVTLVGAAAVYIYRVNKKLQHSLNTVTQTEQRLKIFSTAIEQSPTSVIISGPDNIIQYVNPKFSSETGYTAAEAIGRTPSFLQSGITERSTYGDMWHSLKRGDLWSGELVNRRKNGEIYWEEAHIAPVKNAAGKITHYVAVKLDITERKQAHDRLAHLAHYDFLTNLPNRSLFFERVTQALALAKRNKGKLALMFIDLDKFKPINDAHGHAVGDLLLQEAARRMSGCLRDSDTVGRIGGDEFVVLLPDVAGAGAEAASLVAEKIRMALNQVFVVDNKILSISSSIGIAIYPEHGHDDISLAKHADFAMYHAKASGRDNVQVFQDT
jgi:diguanylate cyclase (GGDEF)-like protein/PAS domain S-box-containing protein